MVAFARSEAVQGIIAASAPSLLNKIDFMVVSILECRSERTICPVATSQTIANGVVAPLSGQYATLLRDTVAGLLVNHAVYITDWIDARHANVDISLAEYLRQQGASEETLRLINVAPNTNDIETTSALWALRNAQRRRDSKGGSIVTTIGGNSRLVEKINRELRKIQRLPAWQPFFVEY